MNLLEHVKTIQKSAIKTKRKAKWTGYREAYAILIKEKEKAPREAVRIIAEFEGLSTADEKKLYNASKQWKL